MPPGGPLQDTLTGREDIDMNNFTFYAPTLFAFGDGEEKKCGELVRRFGGTKVLLVIGGGSAKKIGAFDAVTASLTAAELPYTVLEGIQPNPRSGKVYEGIDIVRREGLDFILALGGGSVIDTAKAIAFGAKYEGDFWEVFAGEGQMPSDPLPIGTVLTIAAAGSEGSGSCVITHEAGNLKWGAPKSDALRPRFSVLNPRYTCAMPPYQTACGIVDMFAHVCERYFTTTPDVALTDRLCEALMKTIVEAGNKVMANPMDYHARADLMWAGMLAHNNSCGVGRAQDWASHQIGHELSAFYDCAHGASLAVVMPAWMKYVMNENPARFARFAVEVFGCELNPMQVEKTAKEGIRHLRSFFRVLGMPTTLGEIGAAVEDIPAMVMHRSAKGFPFGGFAEIGPAEMADILCICEGE